MVIAHNRLVDCGDIALNGSGVQARISGNDFFGCAKGIDASSFYVDAGTANVAVSTANTTLTDTRAAWGVNALVGYTVYCNSKRMVITSNTGTVLTGTGGWTGGGNPGNGNAWELGVEGRYEIDGNRVHGTTGDHIGIDLVTASYSSIIDNVVDGAAATGINVYQSDNVVVEGNIVFNCGQNDGMDPTDRSGISLWGTLVHHVTKCRVANNSAFDDQPTPTQQYGILCDGDTHDNVIENNTVYGNVLAQIHNTNGEAQVIRNNDGYVTENGGAAASIADGDTISHGLAATPTYVTAVPSVAGEVVAVNTIGSSTFKVEIKQHDGSAGTQQTIYWRAWV